MVEPEFGGSWTEAKLERLRTYLRAFMKIFSRNTRAGYYKTVYLDGFAGTGFRKRKKKSLEGVDVLFDVPRDRDSIEYRKGSAFVALETTPPFDEYVFVERSGARTRELTKLRSLFPRLSDRISIKTEDANSFLPRWSAETNWKKTRAVVFLDPFGMQVEWTTIESIARTKAVDLWLLFPLIAVNRLLLRNRPPEGVMAERLTRVFGDESWRAAFYTGSRELGLFEDDPQVLKDTDFRRISQAWTQKLTSVFAGVAPNPLPLRNSKNVPIYLLCFAAANPRKAQIAVRIAQHILSR